jgi:hypothetical protein
VLTACGTGFVHGFLNRGVFYSESVRPRHIDALREYVYSHTVPIRKIQVGQVWKKNDSGESYLITKIYSEALTSYAVLRKAGAESEPPIRIKISHTGTTPDLPGFKFAQDSDEF